MVRRPVREVPLVVHLLSTTAARGSAQARIVSALGRGLDPGEFRLGVWALGESGPLEGDLSQAGVVVRHVPFRGGRDVAGALRFARALARGRPNVVHLHVGGRSRTLIARCLSDAKLVAHLHGTHAEDGRPLDLRTFGRSADVAIATSRAVADEAGIRAHVVHPGVDLAPLAPSSGNGPVVGTAGRLEPVKRLDLLISAAAKLRPRFPDLRVLIAGDGASRPQLERLTHDLSLGDAVEFAGWRDDLASLHRQLGVFCVTSEQEGFGVAALEAMASGVPVVASRVGGLPELVEDGRSGFLVPAGDVDALADRIARLLGDAELRARMGAAARRAVEERFTTDRMVGAIEAVYRAVLG
jgi:glycosyltransferase involved in cell wall biosynthesis